MTERSFPKAQVTHKALLSIRAGHPWIYDTEITGISGPYENGSFIEVTGERGQFLGTGLISDHSKIRIRLISHNANDCMDAAFFERRLRHAWEYRKTVMPDALDCCRLIFGEADLFPGLTVDRFSDILVTQTLSLGMERLKPLLFPTLCRILREDGQQIKGIYERNDVAIRELEGLLQNKGFFPLEGETPPACTKTVITENNIRYQVDFENGQKTGFFLDQKRNRQAVGRLCRGKRVLDCFTHTGSFALNAAAAGAESVHAVDISEEAIRLAQENARLNGVEENIRFEATNVFDLLPTLKRGAYDFIILDPPAFTKSRRTIDRAIRGYKQINLRAMQLLSGGGYLATCSCSHFMSDILFRSMLREAAADAGVCLRQIEARQQSPDHPILWNVPETDYLKFYIFQITRN
ncbi:MAG: class I SAM-dependent rRNA methyltransferase [Provencibacterium sp.]|jgi:23S rRNA (cytosine1962-C5)-methyltransferase|nr:class I SAM-dependent rRNA methyltransferase [Provencibacterium sp.]